MSIANNEAQSSDDILPFRQGALDAAAIRRQCPQFRVLIIGKANAGKTTILHKVCNAKPDAKPVIYDPEGKEVQVGQEPTPRSLRQFKFSPSKIFQRKAGNHDSADVFNPSADVLNPSAEVN